MPDPMSRHSNQVLRQLEKRPSEVRGGEACARYLCLGQGLM